MSRKAKTLYFVYVLSVLAAAVGLRSRIFDFPVAEHDETLYRALVEQVSAGRPYSLRGHPILEKGWIEKRMYDSPLFFHPPAGIYFFRLVGFFFEDEDFGLKFAQIAAFAIFYVAIVASALGLGLAWPALLALPPIAAFTPIYLHTNFKVWIDNPRVAFLSLLLAAVILLSLRRGRATAALTAITSLAVVFAKVDGLLALPFVYALGLVTTSPERRPDLAIFFGGLLLVDIGAAAIWIHLSDALHFGPGRPTEALLTANSFVRFVTVEITPSLYLAYYLKEMATIFPCFLVLLFRTALGEARTSWRDPRWILFGWIATHLLVFVWLSAQGYSKMLRYLVMTTPATCLLFAYTCGDLVDLFRRFANVPGKARAITSALALAVACGFLLEAYQGIQFGLFRPRDALVLPIF